MFYQMIEVTRNYFLYPYDVTIVVQNYINGIDLPSISTCTLHEKYGHDKSLTEFILRLRNK